MAILWIFIKTSEIFLLFQTSKFMGIIKKLYYAKYNNMTNECIRIRNIEQNFLNIKNLRYKKLNKAMNIELSSLTEMKFESRKKLIKNQNNCSLLGQHKEFSMSWNLSNSLSFLSLSGVCFLLVERNALFKSSQPFQQSYLLEIYLKIYFLARTTHID